MYNEIEPSGVGKSWYAEIGVIALFILGIMGWLSQRALLTIIWREQGMDPGCGAIGLMFYGPAVAGVSFFLLLVGISLAIVAKRLPIWFRVVAMVPLAAGSVVGVAICYRGFHG